MKKVMMLGSGELGKEVVIALQRLGCTVIACDAYEGAPAMQVADEFEVFSMLDGEALEAAVRKHSPDIIVPEVESIRTDKLYEFEGEGIQVTRQRCYFHAHMASLLQPHQAPARLM